MTWVRHVAHVGEINAYNILVGKPEVGHHLEDQDKCGKILLQQILGK
jgi:hypothetical protein